MLIIQHILIKFISYFYLMHYNICLKPYRIIHYFFLVNIIYLLSQQKHYFIQIIGIIKYFDLIYKVNYTL